MMNDKEKRIAAKIPGKDTGIEVKQTVCDICCPSFHCGIDAYVKDGKVIKIEGTKEHPQNKGLLCTKGLANRQYIYREDRIKTPLRRVGERGSGEFEPITWEEAYEEIATKLTAIKENFGAESLIVFSGYSKWYRAYLQRFAHSFGTLNYATESSNCMTSTFLTWEVMAGVHMAGNDTANTGVFLGWAFNPYYSRHLAAKGVEDAKARGAKIIIVDPRITPASERLADIHLRPKPGTDGALALAIAHVLIRDNKTDAKYIEKYVHGYDEYKAYVTDFPPEKAEMLTGVPAAQIEAAAAMIGNHGPLTINQSAAPIAHHANGFQSYRAITSLCALTGSFDRKGGLIPAKFSYNYLGDGFETREHDFIAETKPKNTRPRVGSSRFPLWEAFIDQAQANDLVRQIEEEKPYPLKACLAFGMNYRIAPNDERFKKAMMKLDFLVDVDLFMTDTAKFCDIVLPACSSFERSELKAYSGGQLNCTTPIIEPLYESKNDVEIICDLAKALKLGDPLLEAGVDACYENMIKDLNITLDELRANKYPTKLKNTTPYVVGSTLESGFNTKSGKFELYSLAIEALEGSNLNPLPIYEPPVSEEEQKEYPYILCASPRTPSVLHSRLHNVPWNRSLQPEAFANISHDDAKKLNIKDGDMVEVYSKVGSIIVKASLSYKVDIGTIYIPHGYANADVNLLTDDEKLDPYSGFSAYRSNCVGIRKKV